MKKLSVFLILAIAAFAFIGCSDEGTGLRWKNGSFDDNQGQYDGIQWVQHGGPRSQTWNEIPTQDSFTDYKEVSFEHGHGEALEGGEPCNLIFELNFEDTDMAGVALYDPSSPNVVLEKGADATLVIKQAKKK